jgi:predicted transcriptional regulator
LTEAELRLMEILWQLRSATVAQVVEELKSTQPLAYTTVLTTLRILEQKGYVRHSAQGRAFVYHPVLGRTEARRSAVQDVLSRFFDNSAESLVLNLLEDEAIEPEELRRLKEMLAADDAAEPGASPSSGAPRRQES